MSILDRCGWPFLGGCLLLLTLGCREEGPPRVETHPVTGILFVDGQPAEGVRVQLHNVDSSQPVPTVSTGFTDREGKFAISTYEAGDGVPAGSYVLTFLWGQINPLSMEFGGPDKLKRKYLDPATSEFKVTVEPGEPTDLGRIDLNVES